MMRGSTVSNAAIAAIMATLAVALAPSVGAHIDPLQSPDLAPGDWYLHSIDEYSTIHYHCRQHEDMWGRIVVTAYEVGPPMANISIVDFRFSPTVVTIRFYGILNWTNNGTVTHSVSQNVTMTSDTGAEAGGQSPAAAVGPIVALVGAAAWRLRRRIREAF